MFTDSCSVVKGCCRTLWRISLTISYGNRSWISWITCYSQWKCHQYPDHISVEWVGIHWHALISLLLVWTHTRPFLPFSHGSWCVMQSCVASIRHSWQCALNLGILRSQAMCHSTSKYLAAHAKTRHMFCYSTKGRPEELGTATTSRMAIYGIKRFNFRVVCPLRTLLSKNLLMLWIFPFAWLKFYNFIQPL